MEQLSRRSYYDALKRKELLGLKCSECSQYTVPPKATCNNCGSRKLEIASLSGQGIIQTFTVIRVAPAGREAEAPYVVAMVELEEGPWLTGNLTGINPEEANMDLIGRRVKIGHREADFSDYTDMTAVVPVFNLI